MGEVFLAGILFDKPRPREAVHHSAVTGGRQRNQTSDVISERAT